MPSPRPHSAADLDPAKTNSAPPALAHSASASTLLVSAGSYHSGFWRDRVPPFRRTSAFGGLWWVHGKGKLVSHEG